jgi:uncharacterized membrane protein
MNISKSQYRTMLQLGGFALGSAFVVYGIRRFTYPYGRLGTQSSARVLQRSANPLIALRSKLPAKPVSRMTHMLPSGHYRVKQAVTINKPVSGLYNYWRQFENLPQFMTNLQSVNVNEDGNNSVWVVKTPGGGTTAWETELVMDEPNEAIRWRSQVNNKTSNMGLVRFTPSADGRSTEVTVVLEFEQPGGRVGEVLSRLMGEYPQDQLRENLRRFKALMEAGEIPTTKNQSSGRKPHANPA